MFNFQIIASEYLRPNTIIIPSLLIVAISHIVAAAGDHDGTGHCGFREHVERDGRKLAERERRRLPEYL